MLENAPSQADAKPAANGKRRRGKHRLLVELDAILLTGSDPSRRVRQLLKAYQRELARRPTLLQRAAMLRCAHLMALAERAAADPTAAPGDVVKLDNAASRARLALFAAFGRKQELDDADLDEFL